MGISFFKKIFLSIKNSYFPAIAFAAVLIWQSFTPTLSVSANSFFDGLFYFIVISSIAFLFLTNSGKLFFMMAWLLLTCVILGTLKNKYNLPLSENIQFQLLFLFLPLNWTFFSIKKDFKLKDTQTFYFICLMLFQTSFMENFSFFINTPMNTIFIFMIWGISAIVLLAHACMDNNIKNIGYFFALLCLFFGILFLDGSFADAYFCASALILFSTQLYACIYAYFRDPLTAVYSDNSYRIHAQKSFPLKYSLAVICIDDYSKILKVFGPRQTDILTKLIISRIHKAQTGAEIYRYMEDEFILIFKNEDKKQAYEYVETIRRSIAGTEFVLGSKRIVKLTISAGISEKKRSDANADVVLDRTREVLRKAYKFTQNITSKA